MDKEDTAFAVICAIVVVLIAGMMACIMIMDAIQAVIGY